jgi:hypothetical protein
LLANAMWGWSLVSLYGGQPPYHDDGCPSSYFIL